MFDAARGRVLAQPGPPSASARMSVFRAIAESRDRGVCPRGTVGRCGKVFSRAEDIASRGMVLADSKERARAVTTSGTQQFHNAQAQV